MPEALIVRTLRELLYDGSGAVFHIYMGTRGWAACLAAMLTMAGPAEAKETRDVDLELVLAVDVSGSIDDEEARLQRDGFAAAITNPHILRVIRSGSLGRIAVMYVEWSGLDRHRIVADWTVIGDESDARDFAETISDAVPFRGQWTSISSIIDQSMTYLEENEFHGARRVIDISGDGENNNGDPVGGARDRATAAGVTINGLPIINGRIGPNGTAPSVDLDGYYRDCVIGGPGAFLVVARGFSDFARAIRRKLFLELSGWQPAPRRVRAAVWPKTDCLTGEKRMRRDLQELNDIQKDRYRDERSKAH